MTNLMTNPLKIMTQKSGYIEFGIFLDKEQPYADNLLSGVALRDAIAKRLGEKQPNVGDLLFKIYYAHRAYEELPQSLPMIVDLLDKEIIASSIFSTTSIEGTALESEEEVEKVLALPPQELKTVEQRASVNMREAYNYAREVTQGPGFKLTEEHIKRIHALVTKDISHPHNVPGYYRDNPRDLPTYVGHERVGGVYRPPKTLHDIEVLMRGLIEWINTDEVRAENPLIIAPLVHLYFEIIHPFWDGNGRVGRVLEAMILKAGNYRHAPFLMAKYYRSRIEEYFSLFNQCRKAMEKKDPNAHYPFLKFFLEGFLASVEETKSRVIGLVRVMASRDYFAGLLQSKEINQRQYAILLELLGRGTIKRRDLELQPWYKALYHNRTARTQFRDLSKLLQDSLLYEKDGKLVVFRMP